VEYTVVKCRHRLELEKLLNEHARKGWRLHTLVSQGFMVSAGEISIVLERKAGRTT
jgi:hypothetical protein